MYVVKMIFFLLVLSFNSQVVHAMRVMKVVPISTTTGWTESGKGGACQAGIDRTISFVNLSTEVQTITIKTRNVELGFASCDGVGLLSGPWIQGSAPNCYYAPVNIPGEFVDTITLNANESRDYLIRFTCDLTRQNITQCGRKTDWTSPTSTDMTGNALSAGKSTHEIQIAQDKGAVIANLSAAGGNGCSEFKNNTRYNIPINGGRAF